MSKYAHITANTISAYTTRHESMDGRNYLVAPVVLLVEGVHHGSAGRIFYPLNELSAFPGSWNGRPVTLGHPEIEGVAVSASSPEALKLFNLGILFNTRYDEELRGLRSEVWLDVDRARRVAPNVLEAMQKGEAIEVSTGLWFDSNGNPGVWQNEDFEMTATSFRPDHLALLPGQVGACSISDGCGLRANQNEGGDMDKTFWERFLKFVANEKPPKEEQVVVLMKAFAVNQPGMMSVITALQSQLDALDREVPNGNLIHWLEEAFDDGTFILRQNGPEGTKFYKSTFTMTENEGVEISENNFTEVREKKEFIDVSNTAASTTHKEDDAVSIDIIKKTIVDNLIASNANALTEAHREDLMAMNNCALSAMNAPEAVAPAPQQAAPAAPVVHEQVKPATLEEAVALLPDEHQGAVNEAIKANEKRKEEAVENILAAPGNTFTKEALAAMNLEGVLNIEAIVKGDVSDDTTSTVDDDPSANVQQAAPAGNFSGVAATVTEPTGNASDEPLGRPMQ